MDNDEAGCSLDITGCSLDITGYLSGFFGKAPGKSRTKKNKKSPAYSYVEHIAVEVDENGPGR